MTPLHDIGRILSQVYAQNQSQVEAQPPDVPRLAGGLWAAFKFEEAAANYKQHLHDHYGFLHILGHNRPVPLEGVFTNVYLYDRPLAQRRLDVSKLEEQFRQHGIEQDGTKRVDGLSLVQTERHLFILGQPGAGKTTFLKHVALQAAKGDLPGIPIFISLKALADSQKRLLDFMAQEIQICGFPEPLPFLQLMLHSGQMLILLDGLDEVTQAQESALNLIQSIENLLRQCSANHFLITCRTAVTEYQFPGFTTVEMSNFSPEQVDTFIRKWFQQEPSLGNSCLQELNLPEHKGLRDLASTPLLLNLLCLTYDEVGHFPQRRVELYEEALSALLVKWDNSRRIRRDGTYRQLSLGRKRQMLAQIAARTFEKGQYFIPKTEMVRHILDYLKIVPETGELHDDDGEAVLRAIEAQHGIIVERARGVYSFAHLTFQEYFTARYVAEAGEKSWISLIAHYTESQWREVFLLTTSLLSNADDFFHHFITDLEQRITQDSQLLALLNWTTPKANHVNGSLRLLQRALYIYLARAFPHARARIRVRDSAIDLVYDLDLDLDLVYDLNNDSNSDLDHIHYNVSNSDLDRILDNVSDSDLANHLATVLGSSLTSSLAFDLVGDLSDVLDLASALTLDINLQLVLNLDSGSTIVGSVAQALAHTLNFDAFIALDFALMYGRLFSDVGLAQPFIELAQELSLAQGLISLHEALVSLVVPARDAPGHEHTKFTEVIWQIAQQKRQLQEFELTDEQIYALEAYLQGTLLLAQCLKLSAVTNRDGILSRLLIPPQV